MYLWSRNIREIQQQIRENFRTTNSKMDFTQHYRLLRRVNCKHLKCFRTIQVLKNSARTECVHITEGSNIDPGHGIQETGSS